MVFTAAAGLSWGRLLSLIGESPARWVRWVLGAGPGLESAFPCSAPLERGAEGSGECPKPRILTLPNRA